MPPSPSSPPPLPNSPPTTKRAYVQGRQLIVNNKPFLVKGICYSPVPINASVYWDPLGDYFTEEYSYIWLRDLPLMKAMGQQHQHQKVDVSNPQNVSGPPGRLCT